MKSVSGCLIDSRGKIFRHLLSSTTKRRKVFLPVSEEGTDDALGVFGDLHIAWEVEGVLVVHDLAVRSHQWVGVEWCVTWSVAESLVLKNVLKMTLDSTGEDIKCSCTFTYQQASQRWKPPRTTSHTLSRRIHPRLEILVPQERCSLASRPQCRSAPCQSATQNQGINTLKWVRWTL